VHGRRSPTFWARHWRPSHPGAVSRDMPLVGAPQISAGLAGSAAAPRHVRAPSHPATDPLHNRRPCAWSSSSWWRSSPDVAAPRRRPPRRRRPPLRWQRPRGPSPSRLNAIQGPPRARERHAR
jgi:hypothetical protein